MQMKIGENIKRLRRQNGMTQERLAELLGVSYAAVSKWESGNTCPDISLLVPLSEIFGVTTDELLGARQDAREARFHALKAELKEMRETGSYDAHIAAARRAVAEFPFSEELRHELFLALMRRTAVSDAPCENKIELLAEAERLGCALLAQTNDPQMRIDLTGQLVRLYASGLGDSERACRTADMLPTVAQSREIVKHYAIEGCQHIYGREAIDALVRNLSLIIRDLVLTDPEIDAETGVAMLRTSEQITRMIYGDDLLSRHETIIYDEFFAATLYLTAGQYHEMFDALESAYEHAIAFDKWDCRDRGKAYKSPFVYTVVGDGGDMAPPAQERTHNQCWHLLRRLEHDTFDPIRNDERFGAIVAKFAAHAEL